MCNVTFSEYLLCRDGEEGDNRQGTTSGAAATADTVVRVVRGITHDASDSAAAFATRPARIVKLWSVRIMKRIKHAHETQGRIGCPAPDHP